VTRLSHAVAAADPSGAFVVVWNGFPIDGGFNGVGGRLYDAAGVPQTGDFAVNSHTTANQSRPSVSWDGRGRFVVAWQSYAQDGGLYGIFARRFTDVVFANGFQ
jgi:hypothetical protein